jgi:hypothetical protein
MTPLTRLFAAMLAFLAVAAASPDSLGRLRALPGAVVKEIEAPAPFDRAFEIWLRQPVDHDHPDRGTVHQRIFLAQRNPAGIMVLETEGCAATWIKAKELAELLGANQLMVEHRFWGVLSPEPPHWTHLTVEQSARDLHRIVGLLRPLYPGPWVSTGRSKGGMAALFHRAFFPEDVDATVAVAAPVMTGRLGAQAATLRVPTGTESTVDGKMGDGEWSDALEIEFVGGETLKLKQDGQYLYLYIRGETPGVASLGIHSPGSIQILHASAGLITATYVEDGGHWKQVEPFRSEKQNDLRNPEDVQDWMAANLEAYGWCATLLPRAITPEFDSSLATEFKISLDLLQNGESSLSVAFFQRTAKLPIAHAPAGLADDSLSRSLVGGVNHEYLDFQPETWTVLSW